MRYRLIEESQLYFYTTNTIGGKPYNTFCMIPCLETIIIIILYNIVISTIDTK